MAAVYRSPIAGDDLSAMSLCSFTSCASALGEKFTRYDTPLYRAFIWRSVSAFKDANTCSGVRPFDGSALSSS